MKVFVFNRQKDVPVTATSVKHVVKEVLSNEKFLTDEVLIHLVTSHEIRHLHLHFFQDPSITDCISFPLDGAAREKTFYHVLGEVFICPRTGLDFDPSSLYQELTLYVVHGLLHLLGYDDIKATDKKKMRRAEKRHMEVLIHKKLLLS